MARRSSQPRELVRLSPLQFSLSVSIVVILLAAAALAGYYYGMKQASLPGTAMDDDPATGNEETAGSLPGPGDTRAPVTFYTTLTKPREDVPPAKKPAAAKPSPDERKKSEAAVTPSISGVSDRLTTGGTVMLQVASYNDPESARKLLRGLSSEGYAGTVVKADLGDRGVWFRVRVGPYVTEKDARSVLDTLSRDRKLKGFVVRK